MAKNTKPSVADRIKELRAQKKPGDEIVRILHQEGYKREESVQALKSAGFAVTPEKLPKTRNTYRIYINSNPADGWQTFIELDGGWTPYYDWKGN